MSDKEPNPLSVTAFDPVAADETANQTGTVADPYSLSIWGFGAAALLLLALVFIGLPRWVDTSQTSSTPIDIAATSDPAPSTQSAVSEQTQSERSPFTEAQLARERRAAQEVLQIVLEAQENLQSLGVESWANDAYQVAIAEAITGDAAYRERLFPEATTIYQSVADQLLSIERRLPNEIDNRLDRLIEGIEQGDSDLANALGSELEIMAPDRADVASALARATQVSAINALIAEASERSEDGDLDSALTLLREALALDPQHRRLTALTVDAEKAVNEKDFAQAMSKGFEALDRAQFEKARAAFNRAARLQPNSTAPELAREELKTAETIASLNQLKVAGDAAERNERWTEAVDLYRQALAIDPSVLFATAGISRVEPIAASHEALSDIVENSARLIDAKVLAAAQDSLKDARSITDAGPAFASLLDQAETLVSIAATPQRVTLTSDGLTAVVIKRVSKLPAFTNTTLMLRPGQYQAMGSRNGYRDVLIPFKVVTGEPLTVDIRCTEAIGS